MTATAIIIALILGGLVIGAIWSLKQLFESPDSQYQSPTQQHSKGRKTTTKKKRDIRDKRVKDLAQAERKRKAVDSGSEVNLLSDADKNAPKASTTRAKKEPKGRNDSSRSVESPKRSTMGNAVDFDDSQKSAEKVPLKQESSPEPRTSIVKDEDEQIDDFKFLQDSRSYQKDVPAAYIWPEARKSVEGPWQKVKQPAKKPKAMKMNALASPSSATDAEGLPSRHRRQRDKIKEGKRLHNEEQERRLAEHRKQRFALLFEEEDRKARARQVASKANRDEADTVPSDDLGRQFLWERV